ncbi:SIMPL domain-containing protein [Tritonibacter multivorans]|nr:SIMPL domain-containing protein [Tritonibacter multivorans]
MSGLRRVILASVLPLGVALAPVWLAPAAQAGGVPLSERTISVVGTAEMQVAPTAARISFGARAEHKEAGDAMAEVSRRMAAILAELEAEGVAPADLRTRRIDVSPVWSQVRQNNGQRQITGFVASNMVELTVQDLERLGEMLDLVLRLGANDMGGLQFVHGDAAAQEDTLRVKAVEDAMRKARQLAEASGMGLGPARHINDGGGQGRPPVMRMEMARAAADVPVAPGEMTLSHSVTVSFDMFVPETEH